MAQPTDEQSEPSGTSTNVFAGLEEVIALMMTINPVELATKAITEGGRTIEQGRRSIELLLQTLENTAETMKNLNSVATRVNSLLDDIEGPLRAVLPQVGFALQTMAAMGNMMGIKPQKPAS
jgi:methyl-accepting chemotaxis protein